MQIRYALMLIGLMLAGHSGTFSQITVSRIAVIDSARFTEAATGIKKLTNALLALEAELRPRRTELENLRKAYEDATNVISHSPPAVYKAKAELASRLEREIQIKQKEFDRIYELRRKMFTDPIYQDIRRSLHAWARQRGIDIVIDLSKVATLVFVINDSNDITRAFVSHYNAEH